MQGTGSAIQRDVASAQNDMIAEPLVRSVIEAQEWSEYVGLTEKEKIDYVQRVIGNTKPTVKSPGKGAEGSNYINVLYTDADGTRAERFLNALRDRYIDSVVQGVRAEAKATRDKFKDLRSQQEDEYKAAVKAHDDLAKSKGFSATQPTPGTGQTRNEDPTYSQLVASQSDLANADKSLDAEHANLEINQRLLTEEPETIPESEAAAVAANTPGAKAPAVDETEKEVHELEMQILDMREKQKDYRPAARKYQILEEDIGKALAKIDLLKGTSGTGKAGSNTPRYVRNPHIALYQQAIKDAKAKIAVLEATKSHLEVAITGLKAEHQARQDVYTQLTYLAQNVQRASDNFQRTDAAYTDAIIRVEMLSGKEANPFDVVEVAKASDIPLSPNVPIFIAISAFLGLAVGLGTAVASEFVRNGFRGIPDLTRSLATPVLGAVNLITTRAQARRAWTRHAMIAGSSLVIVCAILWITWAYQNDPLRLLGPGLTGLIDDVRLAFRP
jgi:uncharacterized protein involved in exopolysaccharide biosynthesis